MAESNRVKRWRATKRDSGMKALTIWLTSEEELYVKDLAHCNRPRRLNSGVALPHATTVPDVCTSLSRLSLRL